MEEPGGIPPGHPVPQLKLELRDAEAGPRRVDGRADLAAEAGGEREAHRPRALRERPLAGERLLRDEAGPGPDESPGSPLRDPETAALTLGEDGDREVRVGVRERGQVAVEICVADE